MDILSDRVGILLKYGQMMGSLTKRYFFIDNNGVLYYTEKEQVISSLLKNTGYDNKQLVASVSPYSKAIDLMQCSVSGIKPYLDYNFDLHGRSYFELYVKSRDYRSILLFGWTEQFTTTLHDYIGTFRENTTDIVETEQEFPNFSNENNMVIEDPQFLMESNTPFNDRRSPHVFLRDQKYMDDILAQLGGTFVNQKDWHKPKIKVVNPSSQEQEYEETWSELDNGSNYSGPVKNGMPNGFGKEYRPDGSLYTGYFLDGKWHGAGTITTDTLDTYQGEFIDGCICGI